METFDDIRSDADYLDSTYRFLLLHDQSSAQPGPSPVILLSHASLLSFIEVFKDLARCQEYIHDHMQRIMTVFISDRKIIEWNNTINVIDNNIRKVYIFCHLYSDFITMNAWNGCYQARVQGVYLPGDVEYNLLRLGVDYIHQILPEITGRRLRKKLCCHAKDLLKSLEDYYQNEEDNSDDAESVETSC